MFRFRSAPYLGLVLFIFVSSSAHANFGRSRKYVSVVATTSSYSDLKSTKSEVGAVQTKLEPTLDLELGLRIHTVFQFIIVGYQSQDQDHMGAGAGFRIDIPGFFWLGGPLRLNTARRFYPVNTSLFGTLSQTSLVNESGSTDRAVATDMGFSLDIFLFTPRVLLTGRASLRNVLGNSYMVTGFGIGTEF